MTITITYLGHSGFVFDDGAHAVAIDPFLTGNPLAKNKADDVSCQYVVLTHGHADHFGDTISIAKRNDAAVVGAFELCTYCEQQGIAKTEPMNPRGQISTDFGWVALTQAFHSSSFDGQYMGMPCGAMINIGGVTIYHCGDTGLFSDMKLLGEIYKPDIAFIPTGDRFTMGPELAGRAAQMIKPKVAVPMHYGTFPMLLPDASAFQPAGVEVKIMQPGESWQYG